MTNAVASEAGSTTLLEETEILGTCDPCRKCPLYQGEDGCCAVGKSFDNHPNFQRLISLARENTDNDPQTLAEIVRRVVQKSGNRMNFRRTRIIHALMCVLHRLPEIEIDKKNASKPLYSKKQLV